MVGAWGRILHWDGVAWAKSPSGVSADLFSIWGSAKDDVWATGKDGTLLHWDGSHWDSTLLGQESFFDLSGSGANDVYLVGQSLWRWDGASWQTALSSPVSRVWAWAPDEVFAIKDNNQLWRWDGSAWTVMARPPTSGFYTTYRFKGVRGDVTGDRWVFSWESAAIAHLHP